MSSAGCRASGEIRASSLAGILTLAPRDVKPRPGGSYSTEDFGGGQLRAAVANGWISGVGASNMKGAFSAYCVAVRATASPRRAGRRHPYNRRGRRDGKAPVDQFTGAEFRGGKA